MTINPIISNNFHNDDRLPNEILETIDKFLEIEDTRTYSDDSKDKMYEVILKRLLDNLNKDEREKVLKWCKEIHPDA